jgi:hypothetical protein
MTNETEVLRIEGNVRLKKEHIDYFISDLPRYIAEFWESEWSGSIVPQDSPTGMRLYRVEDIENLRKENTYLNKSLLELTETKQANQDEFLSLSEELSKERESKERWKGIAKNIFKTNANKDSQIATLKEACKTKDLVIYSLRNKESRWRTFIKWWKELW